MIGLSEDDDDTSDDGIMCKVPGEESSSLVQPVDLSKRHGDV